MPPRQQKHGGERPRAGLFFFFSNGFEFFFFFPAGSRLSCSSLQIESRLPPFLTSLLRLYSFPYLERVYYYCPFLLPRDSCWLERAGAVLSSPAREMSMIDIPMPPQHWTIASCSLAAPRAAPTASPIARNRSMLID